MSSRSDALQEILEGFRTLKSAFMYSKLCGDSATPLSASQWSTLELIARHERTSIKDISAALGITSSAATQIINGLIAHKFVRKQPDLTDKRLTVVTLTPSTKRSLEHLRDQMLTAAARLFVTFSDKEFSTYLHLHRKLVKAIIR